MTRQIPIWNLMGIRSLSVFEEDRVFCYCWRRCEISMPR